jgi:hypothetical protein
LLFPYTIVRPALGALLAVLAGAAAQARSPQSPQSPQPAPQLPPPIEGVAATVNDDALTSAEIARHARDLRERRGNRPISTPEELQQLQDFALINAALERLRTQAGEDMGLSREEVERRTNYIMQREREGVGLVQHAQNLRDAGLDSAGARENSQDFLYRVSWYYAQTGQGVGMRGRIFRDRYVRPGELRAHYDQNQDRLRGSDEVVLQVLEIHARAAGGLDGALAEIRSCRDRFAAGEASFEELVEESASVRRAERGRLPPMLEAQLADPQVAAFVRSARPGDCSEPLSNSQSGGLEGYMLVRLLERKAGAPAPDFALLDTQSKLRRELQQLRERRTISALEEQLVGRALFWPARLDELFGRPPASAPR